MIRNRIRFAALVILAACPLDGAMATNPVADLALPATFAAENLLIAAPAAQADNWWAVFNDPVLNDLVARATADNSDIKMTAARLLQAQAKWRGARAARLPEITASGSASQQTGPLINAAGGNGTLLNVGATLSYDVDLTGRLSQSARAAALDIQSGEAQLRAAVLDAQAQTAQTYFEIRQDDAELAVLNEADDTEVRRLALVVDRHARGLASALDVERARGLVAAIAIDRADLVERRDEAVHRLSFLTGQALSHVDLPAIASATPPIIPPGIPSAVLARRPDIAAAERAMAATQLRLKIAQSPWLPHIALTANGGVASSALGDLLKSSAQSFGLGLLLSLPLFDGGRRKAGIDGAKADLELAMADYHKQILTAFRDVNDQLSRVHWAEAQEASALTNSAASAHALAILESRRANGLASSLDLLDARRTALSNQRLAVQSHHARLMATAALIRALGGGWPGK